MTKISIDMDEIKKNLKATASIAKTQLTELAKRAQKDFSQKEVLKKLDQVVEAVKAQEFMKNPKVAELTKRLIVLSGQLEKTVTKNATDLMGQVKARVGKTAESKPKASGTTKKKS
jgi:hypothetical protein